MQVPVEGWIRPTMGRVRESLFSMLAHQLPGATVLDLFAGCGLLGLEALSRGARQAFFVDLEWKAVQSIEKNVTLCGVPGHNTVLQGNLLHHRTWERIQQRAAPRLVATPPVENGPFDLVFLDPPYRQGLVGGTLRILAQTSLLAPGALIVVEQEAEAEPEPVADWHGVQNRRYGDTRLLFWQKP